MKKVAILQSNYIPWKGYFDLIGYVDEFIIYDDMQYTRRDWRNRNQIKTPQGLCWLTVPVMVKGKYFQKIRETRIDGWAWMQKHWRALEQNYRRAPHFEDVTAWLAPLYADQRFETLSQCNRAFIDAVCAYLGLGVNTRIVNSWDYTLAEGKSERLLDVCLQAGAQEYVSGPAARDYLDERLFAEASVKVTWFDYAGYPEYPQSWGVFTHYVSVLDLLFQCGPNAASYMKYVRPTV